MKTKWIIAILAILMLAVSCKSKKSISKEKSSISEDKIEQVVSKITEHQPKFNNAYVSKMSLTLELNSRTVKVAANLKLITGSAMHISIMPALGIEMFKMEITRDSIYIFDKFNKRYYATNYQYIEKRFGVELDYHSLEALISNQFFVVGNKEIPYSKLRSEVVDGSQYINYKGKNMTQRVSINNLYRIESVEIGSQDSKYNMLASYADFAQFEGQNFPQKIEIKANNNRNKLRSDFSINRVIFNSSVSLQTLDKSRYQKADIEQLLKK